MSTPAEDGLRKAIQHLQVVGKDVKRSAEERLEALGLAVELMRPADAGDGKRTITRAQYDDAIARGDAFTIGRELLAGNVTIQP